MPLEGPHYFSTVSNPGGSWNNPSFAENAPDGSSATWNASPTNPDWLLFTSWQFIFSTPAVLIPRGFIIEIFAKSLAQTINFYTQLLVNGLVYGRTAVKNIPVPTAFQWFTVADSTWDETGFSVINSPSDIGFQLHFDSPIGQIFIDSARMTVQYNDGFFDPGYGFSKRTRRFKSTRNHQTKIVSQVRFNG